LKKIVVLGASGFVGNYCFSELKKLSDFFVFGTYSSNKKNNLVHLDYIQSKGFIEIIETIKPDIIIWMAGLKNITLLESNHSLAELHNFLPIKSLVDYQNRTENKIQFIFISSDYVFNGKKGEYTTDDLPNPDTTYGKSKVAAEHYIKTNSPFFTILRVGAIIGKGSLFWDWLTSQLKNDQKIELYDDIFSPTPIGILFKAIKKSIEFNLKGIYHVSGGRGISRYDFGKLISKFLNPKAILIKKKRNDNYLINRSLVRSEVFDNFETLDDFINYYKYD